MSKGAFIGLERWLGNTRRWYLAAEPFLRITMSYDPDNSAI